MRRTEKDYTQYKPSETDEDTEDLRWETWDFWDTDCIISRLHREFSPFIIHMWDEWRSSHHRFYFSLDIFHAGSAVTLRIAVRTERPDGEFSFSVPACSRCLVKVRNTSHHTRPSLSNPASSSRTHREDEYTSAATRTRQKDGVKESFVGREVGEWENVD